jgi:hypothetical protein
MSESARGRFVLCVKSEGYDASLEARKVYRVIPDEQAESRSLIRVIDESGEDYLYPADFFVPIQVPEAAELAFTASG